MEKQTLKELERQSLREFVILSAGTILFSFLSWALVQFTKGTSPNSLDFLTVLIEDIWFSSLLFDFVIGIAVATFLIGFLWKALQLPIPNIPFAYQSKRARLGWRITGVTAFGIIFYLSFRNTPVTTFQIAFIFAIFLGGLYLFSKLPRLVSAEEITQITVRALPKYFRRILVRGFLYAAIAIGILILATIPEGGTAWIIQKELRGIHSLLIYFLLSSLFMTALLFTVSRSLARRAALERRLE